MNRIKAWYPSALVIVCVVGGVLWWFWPAITREDDAPASPEACPVILAGPADAWDEAPDSSPYCFSYRLLRTPSRTPGGRFVLVMRAPGATRSVRVTVPPNSDAATLRRGDTVRLSMVPASAPGERLTVRPTWYPGQTLVLAEAGKAVGRGPMTPPRGNGRPIGPVSIHGK